MILAVVSRPASGTVVVRDAVLPESSMGEAVDVRVAVFQ